jgi:hypothetical protein
LFRPKTVYPQSPKSPFLERERERERERETVFWTLLREAFSSPLSNVPKKRFQKTVYLSKVKTNSLKKSLSQKGPKAVA